MSFTLAGVSTFIIVLGALVLAHEFGHFLLARLVGLRVLKFSLGFGPKLCGITRNGTEYLISAVPLGGYVKLLGFDPDEELTEEEKKCAFYAQPTWKKVAVVAAGPIFNIILAYLIFVFVYFSYGMPRMLPYIGVVTDDSPAAAAGLSEGDIITKIAGTEITYWDDISSIIQGNEGEELVMEIEREKNSMEIFVSPERKEVSNVFGEMVQHWMIGIQPTGDTLTEEIGFFRSLSFGYKKTEEMMVMTIQGIVKMIQGVVPADNIGGPILIAQIVSKSAEQGLVNVLMFSALLSVNLGLLNLFPIPVLDGGYLVLFTVEAILRRQINARYKEIAQMVGMSALGLLMIFAFYNDIVRLISTW